LELTVESITMIVHEDEALERVNSPNNLTNKLLEIRKLHSNRTGPKAIPPMVTALAVTSSIISGSQKASGEAFGMTQANVAYHKNHGKNEETQDLIKKQVGDVHSKALDGMIACLDGLKDKIPNVKKATDLSSIASNLARVVEKTSPKETNINTNVKVLVYQPRTREEAEYESIAV